MEDYLLDLERDLKKFANIFKDAADAIVTNDVSLYPVFIAHRKDVQLGIALLDYEKSGSKWSINASTLEELVVNRIVEAARVEDFKKVYKASREHICVFVLNEGKGEFIFSPLS